MKFKIKNNRIIIHRYTKKYYNQYLYINKKLCLEIEYLWNIFLTNYLPNIDENWIHFDIFYKDIKKIKGFDEEKFINGNITLKTKSFIYNLSNCYFKDNDYSIGDIYKSNNSGKYIILDNLDRERCLIRFFETGKEKIIYKTAIKTGSILDNKFIKNTDYSIGSIHKSNNSGKFKIIEKLKNKKFLIEFIDTGNTKLVDKKAIRSGEIKDKGN